MAALDWGSSLFKSVDAGSLGHLTYSLSGGGSKEIDFEREFSEIVRQSAGGLVSIVRTAAPYRTGALRGGLIVSPQAERSATPGKVVYDLYPDPGKNNVFAKYARDGKRYYYPASMEYGFRLINGGYYPGKYYMRDSSIRFASTHEANVVDGVNRILEEMT